MMDAFALYPQGFHPVQLAFAPDFKSYVKPWPRLLAPVKYYYVDFGIAVKIPPGKPALVLGRDGHDQEVPELSDEVPYDPFKATPSRDSKKPVVYLRDYTSAPPKLRY